QWYRNGKAISGDLAKAGNYTLTTKDVGKRMTVKVTAILGEVNKKVSKTSAKTAKVSALKIASLPVAAQGLAKVGETLSVDAAGWSLEPGGTHPLALTYQWYRSGKAISKAKSATYTLVSADRAKTIT